MTSWPAEQGVPPTVVTDRSRMPSWAVDQLTVFLCGDMDESGAAGGQAVAKLLRTLLQDQPTVRVLFPAAPSQLVMLRTLRDAEDIDWSRVVAFHVDEYIGLERDASERFGTFLHEQLFNHVAPGQVHLIDPDHNAEIEAQRYAELLCEAPIDLACLGIGDNGHLAFNDPPVADFSDPDVVKIVELDAECRLQQLNDGCFPTLADVPRRALTITIPVLMSSRHIVTVAPGGAKATAVHNALTGDIGEHCPASVLRTHPRAQLFLSPDSAALLSR